MPLIEFREEKCRSCLRHRINGGMCTGPMDPLHPCKRIAPEGRGRLEWVPKSERMPNVEDADAHGGIFVWDTLLQAIKLTAYNNRVELDREYVTHFARIPLGPVKEART